MSGGPTLVHDFLEQSARRDREKCALISGQERCTFGQIDEWSDGVAVYLQARGIAKGDRVALFLENSIPLVVSAFGVLKAGGVFVVVNPTTKADKLRYILDNCSASALIAGGALDRVVQEALQGITALAAVIQVGEAKSKADRRNRYEDVVAGPVGQPADPGLIDEDLCAIVYTSGSTGKPKGVMLTHRNMTNTAWAISTYLRNVPDDVVICFLPLSFDYGLYQVITGARVGFTVVLERSFAFPYQILQAMEREGVTGLPGVPTAFAHLLQMDALRDIDLGALRYISNTGASFPPAHIRRLQEIFPKTTIFSMYGLTECTRVSYLDPERLHDKIESVGKAMPNEEVYVVDDAGNRVGPGVVGELVVRGANLMRGYWGNPEETAKWLRDGEIVGERVLYSGDLFYCDEEGFLYFVGRKDDMFKCKGEKISPKEVEDALYLHPDVREAAVVGVEDALDGTAIQACVVLREGSVLSPDEVRRHCRAHLENYMVPKFVEVCDSIPKTDSGKIQQRAISENSQG